jgi:hypothetical protein
MSEAVDLVYIAAQKHVGATVLKGEWGDGSVHQGPKLLLSNALWELMHQQFNRLDVDMNHAIDRHEVRRCSSYGSSVVVVVVIVMESLSPLTFDSTVTRCLRRYGRNWTSISMTTVTTRLNSENTREALSETCCRRYCTPLPITPLPITPPCPHLLYPPPLLLNIPPPPPLLLFLYPLNHDLSLASYRRNWQWIPTPTAPHAQ